LKITGERLQSRVLDVVILAQVPVLLDSLGDNELIVIARSIEDVIGNNGVKKISFDPVILTKQIRAGARVVSNGLLPPGSSARLVATLEPGIVSSARVENANGLAANSIVRIIRDRSIRMNFDPYYSFVSPITRIVGKVVSQQNPATPLAGAQVRLTRLNGAAITPNDVQGVGIFTGVDTSGNTIVLGTEKDVSARTNEKGDYNLYFSNETLASFKITDKTLEALESANVPEEVRKKLGNLTKIFRGQERFLVALRETIGNENITKYQSLILEHSENFIRNLTLEVTLAGFNPASKSIPISTAQRKVIDFELVKV
jgi:hypothetical protein